MNTTKLTVLALALLAPACRSTEGDGGDRRRDMEFEVIEGQKMYTVLPKDAIASIDEPRFVKADAADEFMTPSETVLGVVGRHGTAKCYSAWQLDGHEIVNDRLDGEPIAATW